MGPYDFTPLWKSTIGFDHQFDLINNGQLLESQDGYPPYDIARTGEESYRISLALAGFSPDDITISAQQNLLTVAGRHPEGPNQEFIYQGISARPFERRFSPFISHYLCMIEQVRATARSLFCRRAARWRRETRELLGLFRASAAAKNWSR